MDKIEEKTTEISKPKNLDYVVAVGRRKSSSAEIRLYKKDILVWGTTMIKVGEYFVNNKPAVEYFGKSFEKVYKEPLVATNMENKFAVSIKVAGGGKVGQLNAVVLAIARALDKIDKEKFHDALKKKGMLTRDPRVRERRKVGMGGKSRRRKQSPKR
jgi:small subunit ribosomal protein S9